MTFNELRYVFFKIHCRENREILRRSDVELTLEPVMLFISADMEKDSPDTMSTAGRGLVGLTNSM